MTDNNDMPEEIWVGTIRERVSGSVSYRCDVEQIGVNDIKYIRADLHKDRLKRIEAALKNAKTQVREAAEVGIMLAFETSKQIDQALQDVREMMK